MDKQTILERFRERHNIQTLNPMQQLMAATDAMRLILLSPTGSGKTAAFAIRLLRAIGPSKGVLQAVVIAPSRELVIQIADVIRPVAAGLKTVAFYGGHNMADEVNSLKSMPDIIVTTPGRLLDHITRGNLDVAGVHALVLDEYDKSLELGFHDEMRRIARRMKSLKLIILTSATRLAELPDFLPMQGAETVDFTPSAQRSRLQTVSVESPERDKLQTLLDLLRSLPNGRAIVFVNHRESAERVKSLMFTFEDLVRVDSQGIQVLLRNVDKDKLAIALKGASETIKDLFFNNMSSRAGKIIKEDMEAMGPVRLRDVEEAQQYVVTTTKELSNAGEIVISEGKDSDELIY